MAYNPFSLEGKTLLITGASSGIGRGVCIDCSKAGASVMMTARNEGRLIETLSQMEGNGHQTFLADICNSEEIESLVDAIPTLDGIVLCAGIIKTMPVKKITEKAMDEIFKTNILGDIKLVSCLLKKKKL